MLSEQELEIHIRGCTLNKRESQKKIYSSFYGYAMSICHRYTNHEEDATEILNDGFLKVFVEIYRFKPAYTDTVSSFKGWLRKIMIYTAIDHFRKNHKHQMTSELNESYMHLPATDEDSFSKIAYEEIINAIKRLTPGYRTVLNLFIIEGFSHEEIANQLGISVGTSKSNLAKARKQLQKILSHQNEIAHKNVV
ncbi:MULTISPECIES: RNA polymerase sigma factor [Terrimonas]|uniref:RNA polymerase sigma factor n=1 Tax=Terrimonas TaxID=296051 RepID=UPI0023EDD5DD|nr:sigma-70 family RNA polymerase sigma factor [Terrimonas sp. H1YJ31]